ncbi:YIP1 family protein [Coraliomargarita algicola]|uniref:YIP1 family protein n=1 Tax=Coraliomargarita algicola TaxID=3092156 RepID=A0ABZ0RKD5_9BACT|nr:YIP1 family protein [Coraliomargarita sp. J2-16]WPJ95455.1 YIP1 family protein [Coraliomargarita sp. J2-16]
MTEQTNPFYVLTFWYKPGQTMQGLIKSGAGHRLALVLAMLFGLVQADRFYLTNPDAGITYYVIGALAGLLGLYLFAWLLRNFGRWFGGQAAQREVRVAIGLGLLPWLLLFTALIFVLGSQQDAAALANYYWLFFLGFLYGYVILLLSLAAALRLSVLKTFLCLIVTFLVSLFPLTLFIQLVASAL